MTCALVSAIHDGRHPGACVVLAPGTVIANLTTGRATWGEMPPGRMRKAPLPGRGLIASGARPAAQKASSPFATIAVLLDAPEMTAQNHRATASANRSLCSCRNCARDRGGRPVNSSNASLV